VFNDLLIDSSPSSVFPQLLPHLTYVKNFLLTHHHEDHSGSFGNILSHTSITPYMSRETEAILTHPAHTPYFPMLFYEHILYGRPSLIPSDQLSRVISFPAPPPSSPFELNTIDPETKESVPGYIHFCPGHSPDHIVYHVPSLDLLFPGDVYLTPNSFFFRSDEDITRIIRSCEYLLDLPSWDIMLCAHEPVYSGGKESMRKKLDYMVTTRDKILSLYAEGISEEKIAQIVFPRATKLRAMFILCGGDVSPINIVRSTLFGPLHRDGVKKSLAGVNDEVLNPLSTN
jgi:glyoxylase-like metal-dependent hydrolase (beta-lactamase superfamily II)